MKQKLTEIDKIHRYNGNNEMFDQMKEEKKNSQRIESHIRLLTR